MVGGAQLVIVDFSIIINKFIGLFQFLFSFEFMFICLNLLFFSPLRLKLLAFYVKNKLTQETGHKKEIHKEQSGSRTVTTVGYVNILLLNKYLICAIFAKFFMSLM